MATCLLRGKAPPAGRGWRGLLPEESPPGGCWFSLIAFWDCSSSSRATTLSLSACISLVRGLSTGGPEAGVRLVSVGPALARATTLGLPDALSLMGFIIIIVAYKRPRRLLLFSVWNVEEGSCSAAFEWPNTPRPVLAGGMFRFSRRSCRICADSMSLASQVGQVKGQRAALPSLSALAVGTTTPNI